MTSHVQRKHTVPIATWAPNKEIGGGGLCPHASTRITPVQSNIHQPCGSQGRAPSVCDDEQVAQPGPRLPLKSTTHNSTERSHLTYITRRKKRAGVPIRRNLVRRSGRIEQSSVCRDLAGGSKQSRGPFQRTTAQTLPEHSINS